MNNAELSQQGRWKVIRPSLVYRSEAEGRGGREQAETLERGKGDLLGLAKRPRSSAGEVREIFEKPSRVYPRE